MWCLVYICPRLGRPVGALERVWPRGLRLGRGKDESTVRQKDESTVKQKDKPIVKQKDRPGLPAGLRSVLRLLFPRRCAVCGEVLGDWEEGVCMHCLSHLPVTEFHKVRHNRVERLFWGRFPIERATCYLNFSQSGRVKRLVHLMKYHGRKDLCRLMGKQMGLMLGMSGFFEGMDVVIPMPMHHRKALKRGYNQVEELAWGLSDATGLEVVTDAVEKVQSTGSQTRLHGADRWDNVKDKFRVVRPERLAGRHVLLLDDVLTTGSTLTACGERVAAVEGVRVSVLTLALAKNWLAVEEPDADEPGKLVNEKLGELR